MRAERIDTKPREKPLFPRVLALPARLGRTTSALALARFFLGSEKAPPTRNAKDYLRLTKDRSLALTTDYLEWLATIPGHSGYLEAALIEEQNAKGPRAIVGAAVGRPLDLGRWASSQLRSALRESIESRQGASESKAWVRHLTREREAELARALASLPPEDDENALFRAATIEYYRAEPPTTLDLATASAEPTEEETVQAETDSRLALLIRAVLKEARARGLDYLLVWSHDQSLPLIPEARPLTISVTLDRLPTNDTGLLALRNGALRLTLGLIQATKAIGRALARFPARLRRLAWRLVGRERRAGREESPEPTVSRSDSDAITLTGIRISILGGKHLPFPASEPPDTVIGQPAEPDNAAPRSEGWLLAALTGLLREESERHGLFPTYRRLSPTTLRHLLVGHSPTRPLDLDGRDLAEARGRSGLRFGTTHDVLSLVALGKVRPGSPDPNPPLLALIVGHRLPIVTRSPSGAGGASVGEAWVIRAALFSPGLSSFERADILTRAAQAASDRLGIGSVLRLRRTNPTEWLAHRLIVRAQPTACRPSLSFIPLSERARADSETLRRNPPIEYF